MRQSFLLFLSLISLTLAVLSFGVMAAGQSATAMKNSTPAPPSTATRPDSIQDSGLYGYWNNMTGQGRAGGALMGKVSIEGEPLLWNPILISVICDGTTAYNTATDPKGQFLITLTLPPGSLEADAKRHMETHYEGCSVQASFAGFHSSSATITERNLRDDPDLGTITLSRAGGRAAGTALSETVESAPVAAVKAFEKARTELIDQKPDKARRDLEKAVQAYPGFAEAWYQLGKLQQVDNASDARGSFVKATEADPKFVLPYDQLAGLAAQDQKWKDVLDDTSHTLALDPAGTAATWYFNALANFQLGKTDVAEGSALKALKMDPAHTISNIEQLLAIILARKGDYGGAIAHLRNCLSHAPDEQSADLLKKQIAFLQSKLGKAK
jgi:tetratricopeptide (TPR) repeat protein